MPRFVDGINTVGDLLKVLKDLDPKMELCLVEETEDEIKYFVISYSSTFEGRRDRDEETGHPIVKTGKSEYNSKMLSLEITSDF